MIVMANGKKEKSSKVQAVISRLYLPATVLLVLVLAASTVSAGIDFSRVGYKTDIVLRDGDENRWSMGESFTETRLSTSAGWLNLKLNLKYSLPDEEARFGHLYDPDFAEDSENIPGDGSLSGRVKFREEYFQTGLTIGPKREWLAVKIDMTNREGDDDISAGFHLRPSEHINWGITRGLSHPLPSLTELYYYYEGDGGAMDREGGNIEWEAPTWTTAIQARAEWFGRLTVATVLRDSDFRPTEPQPEDAMFPGYTGVIDGKFNSGHITGEYAFQPDRILGATYLHIDMDGRCRTYYDGKQFGYFGLVSLNASVWSTSYRRGDWRFSVAGGNIEGNLGGTVEAWPFLDGLARFLGERRHIVCEGDIDFQHAGLSVPVFGRTGFVLKSQFDFVNLAPDLRYASWRPVIFGFGVDDLKSEQLDITKAGLLRLSINPAVKWKNLRLEGSVSQWIPLYTSKLSDSGNDYMGPSNAGGDGSTTWGGFSAAIRLTSQM